MLDVSAALWNGLGLAKRATEDGFGGNGRIEVARSGARSKLLNNNREY